MHFYENNDRELRMIGHFVVEENMRKVGNFAYMMADAAVARAAVSPAYRQEMRQAMAMAVWAYEVEHEMIDAVAIEDESAARMAGSVCPDCGHVIEIGGRGICYNCPDEDDFYGDDEE